MSYVTLDGLLDESDIVTLHCPLTPETDHLIDAEALDRMQQDVILINTSRGQVIDTQVAIAGLKSGKILGIERRKLYRLVEKYDIKESEISQNPS